ncbi:hypothetical protein B0H67DRAFT_638460 [Lasiosphaeris hirsuta]|uniref:Uncharacterized protein n=1 Tax=Lasiosphaeris hirsuta TaxID=260670 RepID=A0AA40B924_9PEZI|nr:hypothetical protein B0H67DRAFT_638460 [Lasiosphaeris hirsuta]
METGTTASDPEREPESLEAQPETIDPLGEALVATEELSEPIDVDNEDVAQGISAAYIPTQQRTEAASARFNCYLSIDGKPMNLGDLNAETVSHLKIPAENGNFCA